MSSLTLRQSCLWLHRYTGLVMAGFLLLAGLTGALLAFHEELDEWFNQDLAYIQASKQPPLAIADLHDKVIAAYPEYNFSSMPTSIEAERSAVFLVDRARGKQASTAAKAPFQEVYLNPYDGAILGTRDKEQWAWRNTMHKVFWLHRDLLLGDIGKWLLGIISLLWTINCFIGFYLTWPRKVKNKNNSANQSQRLPAKKRASFIKRWLPAWKIRTNTNTFKLNYDLHQAFGLWLWLMLLVIAWSSVGFNLQPVYQPVMQTLVGLKAKEDRPAKPKEQSQLQHQSADANNKITKANSIAYLSEQADIAAQHNGVEVERLLGIRWLAEENQWQMRFSTNQDIGKKGGASSITVDAASGQLEKVKFGYQSSFASKTDQWLATLHMGHIGLAEDEKIAHRLYQVFLALIGLAVSTLSGTGVYLWLKGRQSRAKQKQKLALKNDFSKQIGKTSY